MKEELLRYLVCPQCLKALQLHSEKGVAEEILAGSLSCEDGHVFHILGGIPRFIQKELSAIEGRTQAVFGKEWTTFDSYDAGNLEKMSQDLSKDIFRDKVVLDAGCGAGRHALELKIDWGARQVMAVDLSEAVSVAYDRCKGTEGLHVVQASIYNLPFPAELFDVVFTLGVLQHLPDPYAAFAKLATHVRQGGKMIIWVYKASLRKRLLEIPRFFAKRLPVFMQKIFSDMASAVFYPLVFIHRNFRLPLPSHFREYAKYNWQTYRTDWFDRLSAPLTDYFTEPEIAEWFKRNNLSNIQITSYGDFFIRGIGSR